MKNSMFFFTPDNWAKLRLDIVWTWVLLIVAVLTFADFRQSLASVEFVTQALLIMTPLILLAALAAAFSQATGLDRQITRIFSQSPSRAIMLASLFGALSPFCSCGVIALVAGMLRAGVPLGPVMAFWVASPIMDPQMFVLTTAMVGLPLAIAKTLTAILLGITSGFLVYTISLRGWLRAPLRSNRMTGCGLPAQTTTVWRFWREKEREETFRLQTKDTLQFLFKWLTLAFLLESLMLAYIPVDWIHQLGANQWWTIPALAVLSAPLYLNGYAAIPLAASLLEQGMLPGAALAFLVGGGVTSFPAAMSVFALVRPAVFMLYIALGASGAMLAGAFYQMSQDFYFISH